MTRRVPIVEIPVNQIASLQRGRGGWLIITSGEPGGAKIGPGRTRLPET